MQMRFLRNIILISSLFFLPVTIAFGQVAIKTYASPEAAEKALPATRLPPAATLSRIRAAVIELNKEVDVNFDFGGGEVKRIHQ